MNQTYDALLVVSFGGPEGMDDVMPFLSNVLRGRNVPESRMREVAHHYELFGGVSPINEQNRRLIGALERELEERRPAPARLLGQPQLAPSARRHPRADARRRRTERARLRHLRLQLLLRLPPVPRGHRAGARGRRRRRAARREAARLLQPPRLCRRRTSRTCARRSRRFPKTGARPRTSPSRRTASRSAMAAGCDYERQLLETCRLVAEGAGALSTGGSSSRAASGPPTQPWLEPDICDHLRALKDGGARRTSSSHPSALSPTTWRCSTTSTPRRAQVAGELGVNMVRAATVGTHPAFVRMIRELIHGAARPVAPAPRARRLPALARHLRGGLLSARGVETSGAA